MNVTYVVDRGNFKDVPTAISNPAKTKLTEALTKSKAAPSASFSACSRPLRQQTYAFGRMPSHACRSLHGNDAPQSLCRCSGKAASAVRQCAGMVAAGAFRRIPASGRGQGIFQRRPEQTLLPSGKDGGKLPEQFTAPSVGLRVRAPAVFSGKA